MAVSRAGKTPTCVYLALQYGIRAANYPLTDQDLAVYNRFNDRYMFLMALTRGKGVGLSPKQIQMVWLAQYLPDEFRELIGKMGIFNLVEIDAARQERIMADESLRQETRRWEEKLGGQGRILIRPSGTEALIRVMVEAKTTEIAHQVASVLADFIKKL